MSQSSSDLDARIQSGELRVLWVKDLEHSAPVDDHWSHSLDRDGFDPEVGELVRSLGDRLSDLRLRCWYQESEIFMNTLGLEDELFKKLVESNSKRDDHEAAVDMVMKTIERHGAVWHEVAIPQWFDDEAPDLTPPPAPAVATALVIDPVDLARAMRTLQPVANAVDRPDPRSDGTTLCEYDYDSTPDWRDSTFSELARAIDEIGSRSDGGPTLDKALSSAFEHPGLEEWYGHVRNAEGGTYEAVHFVESLPGVCKHTDNGTDPWGRSPGYRL